MGKIQVFVIDISIQACYKSMAIQYDLYRSLLLVSCETLNAHLYFGENRWAFDQLHLRDETIRFPLLIQLLNPN